MSEPVQGPNNSVQNPSKTANEPTQAALVAPWKVLAERPLAFGGWAFTLAGPDTVKHLEWWPGDQHLTWENRPFRSAPVTVQSGKGARAAAQALAVLMTAEEAA